MSKQRRTFSSAFKTKVALEAIKERKTISELAAEYELHPNQIQTWKQALMCKLPQKPHKPKLAKEYGCPNADRKENENARASVYKQ